MSLLESFRKLFTKKKPEGTEEKRQQIERTLNAKIQKDIKKEKTKKMTIHDFDRFDEDKKEKEMRELIEKKRREQEKVDLAKKRNKTLSSNF
jgi:hypothetical protein